MHNRRTPSAEVFIRQMELRDLRMLGEDGVNGAPQIADAFAVDDPHPQNPALLTFGQIIRHKVLHLARLERVQVEHTVNRKLSRFIIHPDRSYRDARKAKG